MKKYMKLELKKILSYNSYVSYNNNCNKDYTSLYTLSWALEEFYYKDQFIQFLDDSKWKDQGGNEGFIEKSQNMVKIYNPIDDLSAKLEEDPIPSAIISIENLKVITRDWKKLYGNKVPVIYLILQDDGWIVVRETLENE